MADKDETKVAVMPPNPPPQKQAGPVVGGLTPGTDDQAMKSKETIPGGLTVNSSGFYQNANGEYVDKTGKKVDEPVKAQKGETPVQDYHKEQEQKNG